MKWQILIPHIPHRHDTLVELLDALAAQMRPGVQVIIYPDNLEASYATKLQALADAADAEYTSHLSNDDLVAEDFIPAILGAFKQEPDYVGFKVLYTLNGVPQMACVHSLQAGGWRDTPECLYRDLMYYNPIRRDLAEMVTFRGDYCDREWADDLRALGCVKNEVFIDRELHHYRWSTADNFHTGRQPVPEDQIPELPSIKAYPFVKYIHG